MLFNRKKSNKNTVKKVVKLLNALVQGNILTICINRAESIIDHSFVLELFQVNIGEACKSLNDQLIH